MIIPAIDRGELAEIDLRLLRRRMGLRHHHLAAAGLQVSARSRATRSRTVDSPSGRLVPRPAAARSGGRYAAASAAPHDPLSANPEQDQHRARLPVPTGPGTSAPAASHPPTPDAPSADAPDDASPTPGPTCPDPVNRVGYVRTAPLSISPSTPSAPRIALADEPKVEGTGRSRMGPHRTSTSPLSGAKSDCHTHPACCCARGGGSRGSSPLPIYSRAPACCCARGGGSRGSSPLPIYSRAPACCCARGGGSRGSSPLPIYSRAPACCCARGGGSRGSSPLPI